MMKWLKRYGRMPQPNHIPDESTQERHRLKVEQIQKLQRAHSLQHRSSAVASSLNNETAVNHIIERLREAYVRSEGTTDAR